MKFIYSCLFILFFIFNAQSQTEYWVDINENSISALETNRQIIPLKYRTLQLNLEKLKAVLNTAPIEYTKAAKSNPIIINLPLPNGQISRFYVYKSPIMEAPLAAQYTQIQTFACQGIDNEAAQGRIDFTEKGFHAMILSPEGCFFIDPYANTSTEIYISYYKKDFITKKNFIEEELQIPPAPPIIPNQPLKNKTINSTNAATLAQRTNGTQLYTYRIAIAATGEYTTFHGGTTALALSAQITTLNRVIAVYRTELAINFIMVANNNLIIYTNSSTDPYTNSSGSSMLSQNQTTLTSVIGSSNYDIGHVFSTGGGGVAMLASVCSPSLKAQGVTGSSAPVGDPFDIDYVAHEMGHQFGGNHSFNGNTGSCSGGNRNANTAYEPGSGSTIMAYAGICSPQDLQAHSDPYFHSINFDEIINNITIGATGNTGCAVITSTGNNAPTATVGTTAYTIPINTPFMLNGSGTDPDGNAITYYWEQFDLGSSSAPNTPPSPGPRFRSYSPTVESYRIIPKLSNLLAGTIPIGEILPTAAQSAKFRLTVRDNQSAGGGISYDANYCTITFASAGPFTINNIITTAPNTSFTLNWNVNNTNLAPINCTSVNVSLSIDGGLTFPYTLQSNTSNDGNETIVIPNVSTSTARIKIAAVGNIFFNISNSFTISTPPPLTITSFTPTTAYVGDTVTIIGTNLASVTNVAFGGINAANFIIKSSTELAAVVATGGATGNVSITNSSATAQLAGFILGDSSLGIYKSIGTGTVINNSTTYPAPYGNYYGGSRHQFIYMASELSAQGITAGLLSKLGFNVSSIVAGSLTDFTIKVGNTTATSLTSFLTSGLTQVFASNAYTATVGWNMHTFSTPFFWNGTSNIVVEVCFNNNNSGQSLGNTITFNSTGFATGISIYNNIDNNTTVCNAASTGTSTSRPNARLFITKVPLNNASQMLFSNITNNSITVSFTKGSGANRIVVCRPTNAAAVSPTQGTSYNANTILNAANTTGANNFIVYNAAGNSVTVTGLTLATSYTFTVYEYNGAVGNTAYQTTGFSGSPISTLPVKWKSFDAYRSQQTVKLNWATVTETNNNFFTIERSYNNNNWESIGKIKGAGNSLITNNYNYIDSVNYNLMTVNLYYRIAQTDYNAHTSYSKTVLVNGNNDFITPTIQITPNPNNGKFTIIYNRTQKTNFDIYIYKLTGIEIFKQTSNENNIPFDISAFPSGLYLIKIVDGSFNSYAKIVKEN